ncbi:hypothetical protein [Paraherbaspirillum soli]|uniref:Uncharacterized protein n=1 Tax=Paraherbaspirillum soli TaxID=631222 RepID=A0ABW0MG52_9BURK
MVAGLVTALAGDFSDALPCDLAADGFFKADFAVEEESADLAATGFAFFTESVRGFADFFIAFAMESTTNLVTLICAMLYDAIACTLTVQLLTSLNCQQSHLRAIPQFRSYLKTIFRCQFNV